MTLVETPTRKAIIDDTGKPRVETAERWAILRKYSLGPLVHMQDAELDTLYGVYACMK